MNKIEYGKRCLLCQFTDRQEGKREAGEVPARSRHCNCGAIYKNIVTERSGRLYVVMMHKSGNLPLCWYMTERSRSRGIDRTDSETLKRVCLQCLLLNVEGFFIAVKPFYERKILHMKKIMAFILGLACVTAAFSSCGSNDTSDSSKESTASTSVTTEAVTDEETTTDETATDPADSEEEDEENYDTGDASLDNVRNQDDIGENELLVLSFGTSYNDSRRLTIGAIEDLLEETFPDYSVRRGFTANIVIDHVQRRDGILIDDLDASLQRAVDNGVKNLVVQPTHLMKGIEYDELYTKVGNYADAFEKVAFGEPLLSSDDDFKRVEQAIVDWTKDYDDGKTAICFMGHGTEHESNSVYSKLQDLLTEDGYTNYFIGTVEAEPSVDDVLEKVKAGDYERVVLEPLMVVAGDHANNDMAGDDPDSWKSVFEAEGYDVECLIRGLGENEEIRKIYAEHAQKAIDSIK